MFDPNMKINFDVKKFWEMAKHIHVIWLYNSSTRIQWDAQDNAPYQTWTLRKSIWRFPWVVRQSTNKVIIWPRKVKYAFRREFENYKNPHKKFYMRRAFEKWRDIITEEYRKAIDIVSNSI